MIVRIRRSSQGKGCALRVLADIITRLCVSLVPPRTCGDDIRATTMTRITHFSTAARPLEPRYFRNASYTGLEWRDRCLVTDCSEDRVKVLPRSPVPPFCSFFVTATESSIRGGERERERALGKLRIESDVNVKRRGFALNCESTQSLARAPPELVGFIARRDY